MIPTRDTTQATDPLARLEAELVGHGCHTVILYGSRSRGGEETPESDWDLAGFRSTPPSLRIARAEPTGYVDSFVYFDTDATSEGKLAEHLKLRGGRVLREKDGFGTRLLARHGSPPCRGRIR